MSKSYLMRVENNEQTIAKVMDIAGYSHILHDYTYYVDGTGHQSECVYVCFTNTTKVELIKHIRRIFAWGAYGALVDLFVPGTEPYYPKSKYTSYKKG